MMMIMNDIANFMLVCAEKKLDKKLSYHRDRLICVDDVHSALTSVFNSLNNK